MKLFKVLRKHFKNNKGISLLEGIFTTGILSFGLLASMQAVQSVNSTQTTSREGVVASQLANEKLEMILADKSYLGYSGVTNGSYPIETMTGFYSGYTRRVNIYEMDPSVLGHPMTGTGLKKVHVQVSWGTPAKKVDVEGIVSKY